MFSFKFNIKNILTCLWLLFLMVLYIFNILPKYGLEKVGTREYVSVIAFVFVFFKYYSNKYYRTIMLANWAMMLLSVLAALANGTGDFWYVLFGLRNILYINGALLIASFFPKKWKRADYIKLIIIAIIVNSIIAVIAYLNPSFQSFLVSIQHFSSDEKIENTIKWSVRMFGLGCGKFYVGGIINGMGIILTFYLLIKKEINTIIAIVFLFILFFVGVFIARTTIIGFAVALLYYLMCEKTSKTLYFMIGLFSLTIIAFSVGVFNGMDTSHAFEFFTTDVDSYQETQTMVSLIHMYQVDFNFTTFLFGDGIGSGYYKGIDVGWLRNILYFGIIGTVFGYLYYEIKIIRILRKVSSEDARFFFVWFLYLFVLNFKGLPDFNFMILLLSAYYIKKKQVLISESNYIKHEIIANQKVRMGS